MNNTTDENDEILGHFMFSKEEKLPTIREHIQSKLKTADGIKDTLRLALSDIGASIGSSLLPLPHNMSAKKS